MHIVHVVTFTAKLTKCQQHRIAVGSELESQNRFTPQCYYRGEYADSQCHPVSGECWCVNRYGQEVVGTRVAKGESRPRCGDSKYWYHGFI